MLGGTVLARQPVAGLVAPLLFGCPRRTTPARAAGCARRAGRRGHRPRDRALVRPGARCCRPRPSGRARRPWGTGVLDEDAGGGPRGDGRQPGLPPGPAARAGWRCPTRRPGWPAAAGMAAMTAMVVRGVLSTGSTVCLVPARWPPQGWPSGSSPPTRGRSLVVVLALRARGIRPAGLSRAVAHLSQGRAETGHRRDGLSRGGRLWWQGTLAAVSVQRLAGSREQRQASSSSPWKPASSPSGRARWARASWTAASQRGALPSRRRGLSDGEVTPRRGRGRRHRRRRSRRAPPA